jgi:hypothetical protein
MDKSREAVLENARWIKHALADDTDMFAGMMGMHAQFTISDETMEFAAAKMLLAYRVILPSEILI